MTRMAETTDRAIRSEGAGSGNRQWCRSGLRWEVGLGFTPLRQRPLNTVGEGGEEEGHQRGMAGGSVICVLERLLAFGIGIPLSTAGRRFSGGTLKRYSAAHSSVSIGRMSGRTLRVAGRATGPRSPSPAAPGSHTAVRWRSAAPASAAALFRFQQGAVLQLGVQVLGDEMRAGDQLADSRSTAIMTKTTPLSVRCSRSRKMRVPVAAVAEAVDQDGPGGDPPAVLRRLPGELQHAADLRQRARAPPGCRPRRRAPGTGPCAGTRRGSGRRSAGAPAAACAAVRRGRRARRRGRPRSRLL